MKLISSPTSPYVRKIRVLLRELDMTLQVEESPVATSPMESATDAVSANPLGKIPALIRTDGPALHDSRVISRYLNEIGGGSLYPTTGLYEILTLESMADGILDATVTMAYEKRLRGEHAWPEWIDAQWEKAARALNAIESQWISHLHGPLNMAQIAVGCALGYTDFRHDDRKWRDDRPALAAWYEGFAQRASMQETAPLQA